uniref:XPG-I domain-containing protein n=1 Tax=viral metagenome TaxID=1070528 RepID=A0A6C0BZ58_9ZZZZ
MGVNGFFSLVATKADRAKELLADSSSVVGKRVGVDAPVLLHRARAAHPFEWSYLFYIAENLIWLRSLQCSVVFVFDGAGSRAAKVEETAKRAKRKAEQQENLSQWRKRLEEASSWEEIEQCRGKIEQCTRASVCVREADLKCTKRLISSLGFAWKEAPGEAEQFLATLQHLGRIDEIVTEDSDALICGASSIIRNFWDLRSKRENSSVPPQRIHYNAVLSSLETNDLQMRMAAVLAGCDFAPKLKNVGIVKALKVVKKENTLAECIRVLTKQDTETQTELLAMYETAIDLLSPCRCAYLLQTQATLGDIDQAAWGELVRDVESAGEPWMLRSAFGVSPRFPLDVLIPGCWLSPASALVFFEPRINDQRAGSMQTCANAQF